MALQHKPQARGAGNPRDLTAEVASGKPTPHVRFYYSVGPGGSTLCAAGPFGTRDQSALCAAGPSFFQLFEGGFQAVGADDVDVRSGFLHSRAFHLALSCLSRVLWSLPSGGRERTLLERGRRGIRPIRRDKKSRPGGRLLLSSMLSSYSVCWQMA